MSDEVVEEKVTVKASSSAKVSLGCLILSVRDTDNEAAVVVIGSTGLPNVIKKMAPGDAVLFESPTDGILEIRALSTNHLQAVFLVTRVSPRLGFAAGLTSDDATNATFQKDEIAQIKRGLEEIKLSMNSRDDVTKEQLDLLSRSLNEIGEASTRLGRKDWIMVVTGTLSNLCIGAAFSPQATQALFEFANQSLGWVFQNALRLLL